MIDYRTCNPRLQLRADLFHEFLHGSLTVADHAADLDAAVEADGGGNGHHLGLNAESWGALNIDVGEDDVRILKGDLLDLGFQLLTRRTPRGAKLDHDMGVSVDELSDVVFIAGDHLHLRLTLVVAGLFFLHGVDEAPVDSCGRYFPCDSSTLLHRDCSLDLVGVGSPG